MLVLAQELFYSCQKEYSYEGAQDSQPSSGYLVKDLSNNCSLIAVGGNYIVGKNLADSNFLQVQVHVNKTGSYTISSDNINGYSFTASGNFSDTGMQLIQLPASGKPLNVETDVFNLQYDSSKCQVQVSVNDSLVNVVQTNNPDYFPLAQQPMKL